MSGGLQFNILRDKQGMWGELLSIPKASLVDYVALNNLISIDDAPRNLRISDLTSLFCWVTHVLPEAHAYPGVSILGWDNEGGARARTDMVKHLSVLLPAERLANSHVGLASVLDCICWKEWREVIPMASDTDILQGMCLKVPDEKAAEDTHQFVRDESRRQGLRKSSLCVSCGLPWTLIFQESEG